jgi:hypothetical protein
MMSQLQMYEKARRENAALMEDAAWLAGLIGDNPQPLSEEEILKIADSDKPYAGPFKLMAEAIRRRRESGTPESTLVKGSLDAFL